MPPEPLPWDRNSRKHDRSDGIRSVARWRDSHPPPRATTTGWDHDFRRPPPQGHGKQGGYHLFSDDPPPASTPFRATATPTSTDDDINFRHSSSSRSSIKYTRNTSREREIKPHKILWDSGDSSSARPHDPPTQRSVSDLLTYASHPQSDFDNNSSSWDQNAIHSHRYDSLAPIGWKPLKWNRSTTFSSRPSTTTSRSLGGADSEDIRPDFHSGRLTPTHSPSTDAAAPTSNAPFEDTCPRKKQRLGWGQGLAKYEKQKVEGSDETINKTGLLPCATAGNPSQTIPTLPDKTPGVVALSECASPVTTTSVACSSSPEFER